MSQCARALSVPGDRPLVALSIACYSGGVRFAYYQALSRAEKRAYDDSDRCRTVSLADPRACDGALAQIERGLAADDHEGVAAGTGALVAALVAQTSAPPVTVKVLAVRPSDEDGELHGFYEMDEDGCELRVWMRTAAKKKPVAFRSYVRTVLHELCHHLDFARDELDHSFHTEGFFARENDLTRQLLGASKPRTARVSAPGTQSSARPKFLDVVRPALKQASLFESED